MRMSTRVLGTFSVTALTTAVAFAAPKTDGPITYYKDVLPIVQENCQACHRPGGANYGGMVAPMAFMTYEDTRPWSTAIAEKVAKREMPPWDASLSHRGVFANERILEQSEIDTIVEWTRTGAKRGNPKDAPEPLEWPENTGWTIGEPDLVLKMPEPYFVKDDVTDEYVRFRTPITAEVLPEDRWIKAVEFRPGSPVVHHIIADPLGGIAPGNDPVIFPEGLSRKLHTGSTLVWRMHYHKEPGPGTGAWDQSEVALVFYPEDAEITHAVKGEPLGNFGFRVPPGDPNYSVETAYTFENEAKIVSLMPHMHLRGKAAKYEAFYPNGDTEVLLHVPAYDFNWQTSYQFKEFKDVPAGTRLVLTTTWDNSPNNPYNPDPTKTVTFGEPTTAEMSFGFMGFIEDVNPLGGRSAFGRGGRRSGNRGGGFAERLRMLDSNGDGKLQKDELPPQFQNFFDQIDANGDGELDFEELGNGMRSLRGNGGNRGPSAGE